MKTSLSRKYWMAASGLFLIIFLTQHFTINFLSVISEESFNNVSHFMGTNPVVQFLLQPVLIFGVVFHFVAGFMLDIKNRQARPAKYAAFSPAANSTWMSRNMIITGIMVLLFLALHFYDFWIPEMNTKYIQGDMSGLSNDGGFRYYDELVHKFIDPIRVILYCLSFVFLSLHLMHGFQSAFQSLGLRHPKYTPGIKKLGYAFAILIPFGFIFIAVFHYLSSN